MSKKMKLLHEGERNPLSHFVKKSKGKKRNLVTDQLGGKRKLMTWSTL